MWIFNTEVSNSRHSTVIQVVSRRLHLSARVRVRFQANQCEIFGSQTVIETGFCPSTSVVVRVLTFWRSTSVFVRALRFLYWHFCFCTGTSVFVRALLFLSEYFGFCTGTRYWSDYFGCGPNTSSFEGVLLFLYGHFCFCTGTSVFVRVLVFYPNTTAFLLSFHSSATLHSRLSAIYHIR